MTTIERARALAADFYVFGNKPMLAERSIRGTEDLDGFAVALTVDTEAAYLAATRVPQLLTLRLAAEADQITPGTILEPATAQFRAAISNPDTLRDAYQDIRTALAYALAKEAQRNGQALTSDQAALVANIAAELDAANATPAPEVQHVADTSQAAGPAAIIAHDGNEVAVELTALQVTQLLSQQISDPAEVRATLHRLEQMQGGVRILNGRAELLYSEEAKTYIAAMEPRDKHAFDANLTTLQATATPSADDIEADAMDEAAEAQERTL